MSVIRTKPTRYVWVDALQDVIEESKAPPVRGVKRKYFYTKTMIENMCASTKPTSELTTNRTEQKIFNKIRKAYNNGTARRLKELVDGVQKSPVTQPSPIFVIVPTDKVEDALAALRNI